MKTYFLFLLSLIYYPVAAQILPLTESPLNHPNGVYIKDTNNELNAFIGTWKYTNGTTELTISLRKETESLYTYPNGDYYYKDLIIGEYKYIENGIEKVNTLSQFNIDMDPSKHHIFGKSLSGSIGSKTLRTAVGDPIIDILGAYPLFYFTRADAAGILKLKLSVKQEGNLTYQEGTTPAHTSFSVPFGEYLLVKQ